MSPSTSWFGLVPPARIAEPRRVSWAILVDAALAEIAQNAIHFTVTVIFLDNKGGLNG